MLGILARPCALLSGKTYARTQDDAAAPGNVKRQARPAGLVIRGVRRRRHEARRSRERPLESAVGLPAERPQSRARSRAARASVPRPRASAGLDEDSLERRHPAAVVAERQVLDRIHALDRVAEGVDVRPAEADRLVDHAEDALLPVGVEDRLVPLDDDRAEAVHAAHVVDAVHVIR
jgi:hypothetical protein